MGGQGIGQVDSAQEQGAVPGLDRLIAALETEHPTSLTLVPSEGRPILRGRRDEDAGWHMDLECRAPLAEELRSLVVTEDENGEAGVGPAQERDHTRRNLVHLVVQCRQLDVLRQLLQAVIEDQSNRRPGERVAALVQQGRSAAPHRIDVRIPPAPKPMQSRSLRG
ncbi:hypothetical protein [Oryzihumus sp.]|jgi:hypothetical protein|uniref:hypothetical protein n=1 Tax=Oryzihumus sp. TaxID=1968903 RepID=UPI002EDA10AB